MVLSMNTWCYPRLWVSDSSGIKINLLIVKNQNQYIHFLKKKILQASPVYRTRALGGGVCVFLCVCLSGSSSDTRERWHTSCSDTCLVTPGQKVQLKPINSFFHFKHQYETLLIGLWGSPESSYGCGFADVAADTVTDSLTDEKAIQSG